MDDKLGLSAQTRKRLTFIIDILFFGIIIGLFYFFANPAMSVLFPILVALFVGMALQRPTNFLTRKTRIPKTVWSVILVLLLAGAVLLLVIFVGMRLYNEFKGFFAYLGEKAADIDLKEWAKELVAGATAHLPQKLGDSARLYATEFIDNLGAAGADGGTKINTSTITGLISSPLSTVFSKARQIPTVLISAVVCVVLSVFVTTGYNALTDMIFKRLSPEKGDKLRSTKRVLFSSLKKMVKAYSIIICITAFEVGITLYILKLIGLFNSSYIVVISIITAIVDIIPVLGTGTVFIPWAIYNLVTGHIGMGIGLLIGYAVITVIRQIIEPKLVAGQVGISPVITIVSMFVGGRVLGALGIFILPLTVMFIKLMSDEGIITLFKEREPAGGEDESGPAPEETEKIGTAQQTDGG